MGDQSSGSQGAEGAPHAVPPPPQISNPVEQLKASDPVCSLPQGVSICSPPIADLLAKEMADIHQYASKLFDFEIKWNAIVWAAMGAAGGWLATAKMPPLPELTVCVTFFFIAIAAYYSFGVAIPRYIRYANRLKEIAADLAPGRIKLKPEIPVLELADVLREMRKVSVALIGVWTAYSVYKFLQVIHVITE